MKKPNNISRTVLKFHRQLSDDKNHRYKSWEHCFSYFKNEAADVDTACLHLAFYLASWGMYRGSSFLLWKDYRIHKQVVQHLFKNRHLQSIDLAKISEEEVNQIIVLITWIKNWYPNNIQRVNGKKKNIHVTDTLATKILLGTLGCVPAFDRYFIDGLRDRGIKYSRLKSNNFTSIVNFYQKNESSFLRAQNEIFERTGQKYPPMKLVDMYFWEIGYELDQQ